MVPNKLSEIDPRSGFCKSDSIFYSKRKTLSLPEKDCLDVTTFISSQPHRGSTAFIDATTGQELTYKQLWTAVDSVAAGLSELGVRKGQVVLFLSPNSIFLPIVYLSVMSLGAIITTTNPLNTPREIATQIADCSPSLVFTTLQLVPKLAPYNSSLPIILMDDQNDYEGRILTTFWDMIKKPPRTLVTNQDVVFQDDIATLLYSSGTTGQSKGVMSSHRNVIAMTQSLVERMKLDERERIVVCTVPMFHTYGLSIATCYPALGSTIIVLSKFDLQEMLWAVQRYKATDLPLVPPILVAMVNGANEIKSEYDLSSLKSVLCGGAPLSKDMIEGFLEKYPTVQFRQGYALTESNGGGASTETMEECRRYGTAGLLTGSLEAKIVDPETGKALPVNTTGELWLRGPYIMKGYFGNVEATSSTLDSEGWLRTGDLCYIDDDGFIFVVDRLKELIKYKGYQVPPAELEALLLSHPDISDAAVIPFPDKEVGQFPMAYIVRKPGSSLYESAVMNFIAKQVAPYKRIRKVAFIDAIPKNPSGKILRKDLIKLATSKL
ncbi:hypothetical protein K2173_007377 [Erythroxylum novogranatense]|uniref:4-coumarate--CoA ligase n=1 Tax=Erythroxylum novogranatense TaxID=1862640 RepID=A0AAV8T608_9ROSI|nr:hypothetical protein K2173_007377 [Erythroxylum novogranatense]